MINETNEIIVGFDLGSVYSQMSFYNRNHTEPMTVSITQGEADYMMQTPKDLFSLIQQGAKLGVALLSNFFKQCFDKLTTCGGGNSKNLYVMVTKEQMNGNWAKAIVEALEMLNIKRERIFLQDYLESFYYYVLNQKKEIWKNQVALLDYTKDQITGYEMTIDYEKKPCIVTVEKQFKLYLDEKAKAELKEEEWVKRKDKLLLDQLQKMFKNQLFSSAYLLGAGFEGHWAEQTLQFLCRRRHVFQGTNLYTKGACYGAIEQAGIYSIGNFLFKGRDMIEHNIGMQMMIKGNKMPYPMVSAGINCYAAYHECEFLLDDTEEIVVISKSINGIEKTHSIMLKGVPNRPNRATRIRMQVTFPQKNNCLIELDDLGLGELYPTAGKKWQAKIKL